VTTADSSADLNGHAWRVKIVAWPNTSPEVAPSVSWLPGNSPVEIKRGVVGGDSLGVELKLVCS
jgi:hypothetical protein